jgi:hypothetical protein
MSVNVEVTSDLEPHEFFDVGGAQCRALTFAYSSGVFFGGLRVRTGERFYRKKNGEPGNARAFWPYAPNVPEQFFDRAREKVREQLTQALAQLDAPGPQSKAEKK